MKIFSSNYAMSLKHRAVVGKKESGVTQMRKAIDGSTTEVSTSEFAAIIGKTKQWVNQLTRDGVLKQSSRGKYVLGEVVQAYIEYAQGGKEDDKKPRFIDHKTEHERIKTERAAIELAHIRGDLHASADIEAVMTDMLTAFRQRMLVLPTKISPQLVGIGDTNVIKILLTKEVYEALTELSNYDPEMFSEPAAGGD